MKILVISDTHGNFALACTACNMAEPFDLLIHLGDGGDEAILLKDMLVENVIHVAGNCDLGSTSPRELLCVYEGKKLLLVHGDAYGVKSGLGRLELRARELGADAVLFGHTHRATVSNLSGILAVNPGSLMRASQHTTFAIVELTAQGITANLYDIH